MTSHMYLRHSLPPSLPLQLARLLSPRTLQKTGVWVCVEWRRMGWDRGRRASLSTFLRPDLCLFFAQSGEHCFGAWWSFRRSPAVLLVRIVMSEGTPADTKLCPSCALEWASLGLTERTCHTRGINPTVCQPARPERVQALSSKKSNSSLYKMSLILARIGPRLRNIEAVHNIPEIFSEWLKI